MKTLKILNFSLFLILASSIASAATGELKPYKGNLNASFTLPDMQDKQHSLEDYRGNIVLVQFWATYCTPCRKEMPTMNRLIEKMQGKPFKIVTINMAEPKAAVQKFIEQVPVDFPVLMDSEGSTIGQWKVFAAPANFILNKKGEVIYTLYGGIEWDSEEMVSKLTAMTEQ